MKVLVIEDSVTSALVVRHQLERMGLVVFHARNGESGIEMFKQQRPDLVLLDITMPGMDGFEVAHRIRQLENGGEWTPIIFLSARTSDEDLQRGIEVGGDDYLAKPVSEMVLKAKVHAMQRISRMRQSLLILTRKLDEANRELVRQSSVDGLTGIANRRHFDETLQREWRRAVRARAPISLLVADVDAFKQFNDGYGHQVGDECLKGVARTLEHNLRRPTDLIARYGGEEFAGILPETTLEGARAVAEAMRAGVQNMQITHRFSPHEKVITISIGVACVIPEADDEQGYNALLRLADQALYRAKNNGRNRVEVHLPASLSAR